MTRETIARQIAEELLDTDTLDMHNWGNNAEAVLDYVQSMILRHLKDYMILSGTVF